MITVEEILSSEVRALSWKQPYASAMLCGKIETRSWSTNYRGLVLICVSKEPFAPREITEISGSIQEKRMLLNLLSKGLWKYYNGFAIAIARLVDCRPMTKEDEAATFVQYKEPWTETAVRGKHKQYKMVEHRLWCHVYEDVTPITPFTFKGAQGWKKLEGNFIKSFILPDGYPQAVSNAS
jgi:hypothetical protein